MLDAMEWMGRLTQRLKERFGARLIDWTRATLSWLFAAEGDDVPLW